jgi:hypothetical protein
MTNLPQSSSSRPKAAHVAAAAERSPHFAFAVDCSFVVIPQRSEGICFSISNFERSKSIIKTLLKTRFHRLTGHGNHPIRLHRTVRHIRSRNGVYVSLHHASSPQRADHGPQRPSSDQQRRRHSSRNPGERAQRPSWQLLTRPLATAARTTKRLQLTPTPKAQDICSRKRASAWHPQRAVQDQAPVHPSPYDFYLTCTTSPTNISTEVHSSHLHEENL